MNRLTLSLVCMFALWYSPAFAQKTFDAKSRAAKVAPFLTEDVILTAHVDIAKMNVSATLKRIADLVGVTGSERDQLFEAQRELETLKTMFRQSGVSEIYLLAGIEDVVQPKLTAVLPIEKGGDRELLKNLMLYGPNFKKGARSASAFEVCEIVDDVMYCGEKATFERLRKSPPPPRPALEEAFAAAGDTTLQIVLTPTDDHRRVLKEFLPNLPETLGGGDGKTLADALLWAAAGIDAPPKMAIHLIIQSQHEKAAKQLEKTLQAALQWAAKAPPVREQIPMVEPLIRLLAPKAQGARLTTVLNEENEGVQRFQQLLTPPLAMAKERASRSSCTNNMKQLGLAMHNFHDVYKGFPPSASYDKNGKKLLSWRVYVLPFIEHAELYQQFHLDEPWDSEHNKKLIAKMPAVYACRSTKLGEQYKTSYLAPIGEKTIFFGKKGIGLRDITDGTSNTIMIVEADPKNAVIWTKPDDWEVDFKNPQKGLGGVHPKIFHALFADGSVHALKTDMAVKTLRLLLMRNDGQPIDRF